MTSTGTRAALMASGLAALILAGCREEALPAAGEPLFIPAATDAAYGLPIAPAWQALPPAPPALVRYAPDYGDAERAYALDRAFYEAPPDYGFSYVDAQPWAWRTDEGYEVFAEPIDDGYRYYYYEPYEPYPFFVRTPDYGYGYAPGGVLTVVYSSLGVILPTTYVVAQAQPAGLYWSRAHSLYVASRHKRAPVVYDAWLSRRPAVVASQARWMQAADRDDWRRWRDRHDHRDLRRFEPERERRAQQVARMEREEVRQAVRRVDNERGWLGRPREDRGQVAALPPRESRGQGPRIERPDRPQREDGARPDRDQRGQNIARLDRPDRAPPPQRVERPPQADRARQQRLEPPFRADRPQAERQSPQRPDRQQAERPQQQRADRFERQVRPERQDRPERQARIEQRAERQRPDRAERQARVEPQRAERPQRQERPQQQQAAQPDRGGKGDGGGPPAREGRQHGRER